MRKVTFLIPILALACGETAKAPRLGENSSAISGSTSCEFAPVTLTATDIRLIPFSEPGDPEIPPVAQFSCDSILRVDRFTGTAVQDNAPEVVGEWVGRMTFHPIPINGIPDIPSVDSGPLVMQTSVRMPDGRQWIGFLAAVWTPTTRSCEIVDDVMRIRIDGPGGFALSQDDPLCSGAAAGVVSGHLDVAPDLSVLSSLITMRLLNGTDPASVTLTVSNKQPPLGTTEVVTATVRDFLRAGTNSLGQPVSNASVVFAISGASTTTLACITDDTGRCSVSYSGPAVAGRDTLTVFADINGDGALSFGEPSRVVELLWGDATPPVVSAHEPVAAEATGPDGAFVTFDPPAATDDVGVVGGVECSPPSGSLFPLGTTTVACSARDAAGNTGSSSFEVSVHDTTPPVISFSGNAGAYSVDQTVDIHCFATDLVTASPSVTCSGGSGPAYAFDLGPNDVFATATDDAGNEATATTTFVVDVTVEGICSLAESWSHVPNVPLCKPLQALTDRLTPAQRAHLVQAFIRVVERHSGKTIASDKADILIRLAGAL